MKKVIFPLEILPVVALVITLFHAVISLIVLLAVQLLVNHVIMWTSVLLPIVILPLLLGTLGFCWFIAALGVYIRDIAHIVGLFTTSLMFLTPIMYPITALPQQVRGWMFLNPLVYVVEQSRAVLIYGEWPDMVLWLKAMAFGFLVASLGFAWFQRTRRGFADVL